MRTSKPLVYLAVTGLCTVLIVEVGGADRLISWCIWWEPEWPLSDSDRYNRLFVHVVERGAPEHFRATIPSNVPRVARPLAPMVGSALADSAFVESLATTGTKTPRGMMGTETTTSPTTWQNRLPRFAAKLVAMFRPASFHTKEQVAFVDLAPTDEADEAGVYSAALHYATNNPRISNIALTGPYGSGKSSIIQSFLKTYPRRPLQISLAAFVPDAAATSAAVTRQEIERSILQQMLYGADANRLPFSRFKRIKAPGRWSAIFSLYLLAAIIACWHVYQSRTGIAAGTYFRPFALANWRHFTAIAVALTFGWFVVDRLYRATFAVSLKSISLKDIEITPAAVAQESILNRHLDEIIYFFQSTPYDLVVIEDLDRFENADIFVTLREINSIVNANEGVRRPVRFLYALRDDMFVNTDRTKFFEFIVPVIPIINSSNSIDKVLEQGKRLSIDGRLDRQFLREVSRYLNDLRLIHNIFNEYAIYAANLESDHDNVLNPNKLLAVLIYKNVFPRDFEDLHRDKGNLAHILAEHGALIARGEASIIDQIARLEHQIDVAERQIPLDLLELRRIYAMALIERVPSQFEYVLHNQAMIALSSLPKNEVFEQIIASPNVTVRHFQGFQQSINISTLQADVDPTQTYKERKATIEARASDSKAEIGRQVRDLRARASTLRAARFNEIIRLNVDGSSEMFAAFEDNIELARFLILEGFLDDTYYQYTSLFHTGRLSPNDNKFLIQIRSFATPEPSFPVDNPKEVIAAMRPDDFGQSYVLNVRIVDTLLGDRSTKEADRERLLVYLSANFAACDAFFIAYYATGEKVPALIVALVEHWTGFVPEILSSHRHVMHVGQLLARYPEELLSALDAEHPDLREYVAANFAPLLRLGLDIAMTRFRTLDIRLSDLSATAEFPGTARYFVDEGLYDLTAANLAFALRTSVGIEDEEGLRVRNYSTIRRAGSPAISKRVADEFAVYVRSVLLQLNDDKREDVDAILDVLDHDEVEFDDRVAFLARQATVVPSLNNVPEAFYTAALQNERVAPSWSNCRTYLDSTFFDPDVFNRFLERTNVQHTLSSMGPPSDDPTDPLLLFVIENNDLSLQAYRTYARLLSTELAHVPTKLKFERVGILIELDKLDFSDANFRALEDTGSVQLAFAARNVQSFLESRVAGEVGDAFREALLKQDIGDAARLAIARAMDLSALSSVPERAAIIGQLMIRTGADLEVPDSDAAIAVIINGQNLDAKITLLNRLNRLLSNAQVRTLLHSLPRPYSEIRSGYYSPRVAYTPTNIELATWLDARHLISSWAQTYFGDEIKINPYRRDRDG